MFDLVQIYWSIHFVALDVDLDLSLAHLYSYARVKDVHNDELQQFLQFYLSAIISQNVHNGAHDGSRRCSVWTYLWPDDRYAVGINEQRGKHSWPHAALD